MKSILEKIGLFTSLLIVVGLLQNYFYYLSFNVRIFDFVSFSESLILFNEFTILIVASLAFFVLFVFLIYDNKNKSNDDTLPYFSKSNFFGRIFEHILENAKQLIGFVFLLIINIVFWNNVVFESIFIPFLYASVIDIILEIISLEVFNKYFKIKKKRVNAKISLITHFSIISLSLLVAGVMISINIPKKIGLNKKVTIYFYDNSFIESTKQSYYIGKTTDFIFYYSPNEQKTTVYKMDDVKKLEYNK